MHLFWLLFRRRRAGRCIAGRRGLVAAAPAAMAAAMAVGAFFAVRRRALGRLGRLRLGAAALGVLARWLVPRLARAGFAVGLRLLPRLTLGLCTLLRRLRRSLSVRELLAAVAA